MNGFRPQNPTIFSRGSMSEKKGKYRKVKQLKNKEFKLLET